MTPPRRRPHALPRSRILRSPAVFRLHFARGVRVSAGPLLGLALPGPGRIGITVPGKVGSAVIRNRIRRRIREAYRLGLAGPPPAADIVLLVRPHPPLPLADYAAALSRIFTTLRKRLGPEPLASPPLEPPPAGPPSA